MSDWVESGLTRIGITGTDSKALQFVVGLGLVAFSLVKYKKDDYEALYIIGILAGGYFILKSIK